MKFTILTEPVGMYYNYRTKIKKIVGRDRGFGGHAAVTRSLITGLNAVADIEYNYRPKRESDIYPNVHVLAGVKTLQYAIDLKKAGKIKHLTAGPNIVVFSTDADGIASNEEIDAFFQPSQWAADLFISQTPSLKGRCIPWAAGIDLTKFFAEGNRLKRKVLIYHKGDSMQFCYRLQFVVRQYGYEPIVISYGNYNLEEYISALSESLFMISDSRIESQGIFMAEAWAMDVPTICFDAHYYHWSYGNNELDLEGSVSSCPYLSDETGVRFETISELKYILENWSAISPSMHPRKWVEENMSDEACAKRFIKIVENIYEK